ncbi:MAG: 4Fe-4S binding protein [Bacteroides sp.]|nr:4Fe-4S binding protein [Bacteroides sp.]
MKIEKIKLITFSPTHTSKQVGEAIVQGTGILTTETVDLTLATPVGEIVVDADELAVITVPVYGGHVAPLAMKRLESIHSEGAPAVLVAVYGNRAYEKALTELDAFVRVRGLKVIAGATFIGEHSYSSKQHPIAVGRPDAADLAYAEEFGNKVAVKIADAPDYEHLYGVAVANIRRPKQPIWPMLKFIRQVMKWRKHPVPMPRTPKADAQLCKQCGLCARHCPTGAIRPGDECNTIAEICIKCCACVKVCPHKARTFDTPFAPLLSANFSRRKEPQIII